MATPDRSIELHTAAAEQLELAASHNREAAKHYERGEPVKAAHHAHIARGHFLNAQAHVHEAAKVHAATFSARILTDPSH
jgi:hypothetical protein